jgi:hypothetical protein
VSIKYEINQWGKSKITPVVCIKETLKQVWIERTDYWGRKDVSRRSKEGTFFDTWKEAHNFLVNQITAQIEDMRTAVARKESERNILEAMTEPAAETQP